MPMVWAIKSPVGVRWLKGEDIAASKVRLEEKSMAAVAQQQKKPSSGYKSILRALFAWLVM